MKTFRLPVKTNTIKYDDKEFISSKIIIFNYGNKKFYNTKKAQLNMVVCNFYNRKKQYSIKNRDN